VVNWDINDAIDYICAQRQIDDVLEIEVHDDATEEQLFPPPAPEGRVRLVIYYKFVPDPDGVYVDECKVWARLRILARLHRKGYLYTFYALIYERQASSIE
jgi:hypothetical protein